MENEEPYIIKTKPGSILEVTGMDLKNIKLLYCSNSGALIVKPKRRTILHRIKKRKARAKRTRRGSIQTLPK